MVLKLLNWLWQCLWSRHTWFYPVEWKAITVWGIGFLKQWFVAQCIISFTMEKSWTTIDSHCKNFNSLILSFHTWNIPKKHTSRIFTACRSDLNTSWECFMCDNSELSCWNFYRQSMSVHNFSIVKDRIHWAINHCLAINHKPIPHPDIMFLPTLVKRLIIDDNLRPMTEPYS